MKDQILLYDCERDRDLKEGEAIIVYEDGKTKRVRELSLYPKEEHSVREPDRVKKSSAVRSRATGTVKSRKARPRRSPARKRTAVYKA